MTASSRFVEVILRMAIIPAPQAGHVLPTQKPANPQATKPAVLLLGDHYSQWVCYAVLFCLRGLAKLHQMSLRICDLVQIDAANQTLTARSAA